MLFSSDLLSYEKLSHCNNRGGSVNIVYKHRHTDQQHNIHKRLLMQLLITGTLVAICHRFYKIKYILFLPKFIRILKNKRKQCNRTMEIRLLHKVAPHYMKNAFPLNFFAAYRKITMVNRIVILNKYTTFE